MALQKPTILSSLRKWQGDSWDIFCRSWSHHSAQFTTFCHDIYIKMGWNYLLHLHILFGFWPQLIMSEDWCSSPSLKSRPSQNAPKATSESSKTTRRHRIRANILCFSWTDTSSNLLHPAPEESNFTFTENYNQKPIWFVTCWLKSSTIPICHNLAQTVWNPELQLILKNMHFFQVQYQKYEKWEIKSAQAWVWNKAESINKNKL